MKLRVMQMAVLLSGTAILSSLSMRASGFESAGQPKARIALRVLPRSACRLQEAKPFAVERTKASGVWYNRPAGSAYFGSLVVGNQSWYIPNYTILLVPPFRNVTYTNQCTDKDGSYWSVGGQDVAADDSRLDGQGNLTMSYQPVDGTFQPMPQLIQQKDTFSLGIENSRFAGNGVTVTGLGSMTFNNPTQTYMSVEGMDYAYGSIDIPTDDKTYHMGGLLQIFDKPISPMWINEVAMLALSKKDTAIAKGATLTLEIRNIVTNSGRDLVGDQVLASLTCDSLSYSWKNNGTLLGKLIFTNDDFRTNGLLLNDKFAVVVRGFHNDGVTVGLPIQADYASDVTSPTQILLVDDNQQEQTFTVNYGDGFHAPIEFNALFDGIRVDTLDNFNILRVSSDGKSIYTDGTNGTGANFAFAYTARQWNNADGTSNYTMDLPSWVTSVKVNDSFRQNSSVSPGCEMLQFTCDPLPEGVTGRTAKLWIKGKGVTAAKPIILLQGDAKLTDGIGWITAKAAASQRVYNLNGQRVAASYHGIVIKNGKKVLVK